MPKFAVMNNDVVANIIVAESKEIAEAVTRFTCIEYANESPVAVGFTYDSETNTFTNPFATEEE